MTVVSMVVGATGPNGATFVAKVTGGPVRVAVADNDAMADPVFTASQAVDAQGVAKVSISGLQPGRRYFWQTEDNGTIDTTVTGQFRTHPTLGSAASFTVAVSGDAGLTPESPGFTGSELAPDRISDHPVFDTIRERALADDWLSFVHLGDLNYYDLGSGNHGIVGGGSLANYRTSFDDILAQPRQAQLYRDVAWTYVWDDHDYGPNDSDGTLATKANAAAAYRERVPHYPLTDSGGIWQAWQVGRVQFVMLDVRYYRSPNSDPQSSSKTMLGTAQKAWLADLLDASTASVLVLFTSSQWLHPTGSDTWSSFTHERDEIVQMLSDHEWLGRMVMVHADRHGVGITGGATNPWGGFPVAQFAAMDATPSSPPADGLFDVLPDTPGRNQYGTVAVTDLGSAILVKLTAWNGTDELGSYTHGIALPQPVVVPEINRLLHGSHRATFEARVLTTFQTGDDPDGEEIPILGGDVRYDATAKVFASLALETRGHNGKRSLFPRTADDLLAPYGNEVFVRRGVDTGAGTVWVPLGIFRLNDTEQDGNSSQPIDLGGQDRMAGIIDGRLVEPRQFPSTRSVASVVNELVRDIYPDAVVLFDDNSGQRILGRQLVVEEDRYAALLDIAESLGKVLYWDGEGFLRIEDAPDPDDIVWSIKAGHNGVLATSRRGVSREGMNNGVVAKGEGASENPVAALAVDDGPHSPTRWGGRFGKVPRFFASPLLTNVEQCRKAAASILRRRIGMPYSVNWGSVPNPALRPRQAVRITQLDGTREKHIVQTLTVPLRAGQNMAGTTREQTLIRIGQIGVTSEPPPGSEES